MLYSEDDIKKAVEAARSLLLTTLCLQTKGEEEYQGDDITIFSPYDLDSPDEFYKAVVKYAKEQHANPKPNL